jgi:hypothetical protein
MRAPSSYPLCNVSSHHSHSATGEINHHLTIAASTHPVDSALNSITPTAPDIPSFPALTSAHSSTHLAQQSLHDGNRDTPIAESSRLSTPDNIGINDVAASPDPPIAIATENRADPQIFSPMDSSGSDTPPTMAAAISPLSSSLLSNVALYRQHHTDLDVDLSSIAPDIPSSSLPVVPVSGDTCPGDPLMSSARSSTWQIDLITPGSRLLTLGPVPEISLTPPQMTSDSQPNLAQNDATFDTHHNSQTPELSNTVKTSQQAHEPATPALDSATDLSRHPADTAPPCDVDHPR